MAKGRSRQRLLSILAFSLLALIAELAGRSLTQRINIGRHVRSPSYSQADYYPFLLAAVKVGIALLLARLLWRLIKAHSTEQAARRVLAAVGARPRVRVALSHRLWLAFFSLTAVIYLLQTDAERIAAGEGASPFWPWLHSSALSVFAVLAVLMALVWGAVQRWLADYERFAEETAQRARRLATRAGSAASFPLELDRVPPRRLFGLAFESRPPPVPA